MSWMVIDDATPHDREILVWSKDGGRAVAVWQPPKDRPFDFTGWVSTASMHYCSDDASLDPQPTHWTICPAAPDEST